MSEEFIRVVIMLALFWVLLRKRKVVEETKTITILRIALTFSLWATLIRMLVSFY